MSDWVVYVEPGAYEDWMRRANPSVQQEVALIVWLVDREQTGPPPIVGYSDAWVSLAEAPLGVLVEFAVIPEPVGNNEPPFGIIAIRKIASR